MQTCFFLRVYLHCLCIICLFQVNADCGKLVDDILASDDGPVVLQCAGGLMVEHPLLRPHVRGCVETEPVS